MFEFRCHLKKTKGHENEGLIGQNVTLKYWQVLVATDAIGMGLNLNIRRIIFNSVTKIQLTENGEKEMDIISVSQALQIAGRAGR